MNTFLVLAEYDCALSEVEGSAIDGWKTSRFVHESIVSRHASRDARPEPVDGADLIA